jgi:hypothetical protein
MKKNSLFVAAAVAGLVSVAAYADEAIDIRRTPEFQGSQTHAVVPAKRAQPNATRTMGAAGSDLDRASVRAQAIKAARDGQIKSGEIGAW